MKIVADENIPFAREAFGELGDVTLVHGRRLSRDDLTDAGALFVRSITKVNDALVEGSRLRFVGTATAGVDHIDTQALARRGIGFAAAPGCNANSVAEYMAAAWLTLGARKGFRLEGLRVGIVGVGNVGSRVEAKARALGMEPVLNDPPKARETEDPRYVPIEDLARCDIVTMHTPLTKDGPDPTWHLAGDAFFARLRDGAIFCNAGRGGAHDTSVLKRVMAQGRLVGVVLDVWEDEPLIDPDLVAGVDLGSPHIAGYSYDGKINGTIMVYEAACRCLGLQPTWDAVAAMPPPEVPDLKIDVAGREDEEVLREAVLALYPIERDDADLRATMELPVASRGTAFDRLRKEYPRRREFHNTRLELRGAGESLRRKAAGLGFRLV